VGVTPPNTFGTVRGGGNLPLTPLLQPGRKVNGNYSQNKEICLISQGERELVIPAFKEPLPKKRMKGGCVALHLEGRFFVNRKGRKKLFLQSRRGPDAPESRKETIIHRGGGDTQRI